MSASPTARQAITQALPMITRKVVISDPIQMPEVYSSTPGGTLYSTTPGGKFRKVEDETTSSIIKFLPESGVIFLSLDMISR